MPSARMKGVSSRPVRAKFTPSRRPPIPTANLVGFGGSFGTPRLGGAVGARPGASATAPAASSAPAASTAPPVDPQYDAAVAIAARNRDARLAALSGQRAQTLTEVGYTPQTDAAGNITGLVFDPNNAFSQAALAKKAYDTKRRANTNSLAARGQLYAGSLQNAQNDTNTSELQSRDALQKALIDFLSRNTADVASTQGAYLDAVTQAQADRLSGAATNPLYEPSSAAALPSTSAIADAVAAAKGAAAIHPTRPSAHSGFPSPAAVRRALAQRTSGRARPPLPRAKFTAPQNTPLRHRRP